MTTEECPFGPDTIVYKVAGKMFALTGLDAEEFGANLKCEPEYALDLRERYSAIKPGWHMNKTMWNTVNAAELNDDRLFKKLIDHSYDEVVKKLTKKVKSEIQELLDNK
jgi:predicted DNA-binding protein (MmcQ/YjbR family)